MKMKSNKISHLRRRKAITVNPALNTNLIRSCNSRNWGSSLETLFWMVKVIKRKIAIKSLRLSRKQTEDNKN